VPRRLLALLFAASPAPRVMLRAVGDGVWGLVFDPPALKQLRLQNVGVHLASTWP